jgi:hypothetical protein
VVDALELAPPLPGSFMLDVYAPAELQLTMVEDGVPLARTSHHNTLVSTLRAIEAACAAVEVPIPENVDDLDQVIAEGVSTNLLNAIIRLDTQRPGLRIEFKGRWTYPDPLEPGPWSWRHVIFAGSRSSETSLRRMILETTMC